MIGLSSIMAVGLYIECYKPYPLCSIECTLFHIVPLLDIYLHFLRNQFNMYTVHANVT